MVNNQNPKSKLAIFSWSLYDFANTIFAMNIISLYFALWVTVDMKAQDIFYSFALSISMLLAAITAPILGVLSDRIGKRMPFLFGFTLICCLATALIALAHSLFLGLFLFVIANLCYQIADVFYNSLLPEVSDVRHFGRVSGYGVSLGYFGTITGLAMASPFVLKFGHKGAFIPTAILFFLFALPCFIFVKEKSRPVTKNKISLTHLRKYPELLKFLLAAFIALNAINTIYIFMSVYIKKVVLFSDSEMIIFYLLASCFAIGGAFFVGHICDKIGPKKALAGVFILWIAAISLALFSARQFSFWFVGPLAGIALGGTWTAARALTIKLSPKNMVAEVFGLYGFVGKTASIIGPLIWGTTIWAFDFLGVYKYQLGITILSICIIIGFCILMFVNDS